MSGAVFRRTPNTAAPPTPPVQGQGSIFRKIATEKSEAPKPAKTAPGNYEISDEDLERQSERGIATALSRVAEGALGTPGNIGRLVERVTGGHLGPLSGGAKNLPTSQELRQLSEEKSEGHLKSEGPINEIAADFLTDVGASLPFAGASAIPGTAGRGLVKKVLESGRLFQPFVTPIIGQTAKQIAKKEGAKESTQDWTKLGSMIFTDTLLNRGRGSQGLINHLFDEANSSIKGGAFADAANLRHAALNLRRNLKRGGSSPTKTPALTKIDEVIGKMKPDGTIDVRDLVQFRRDFNAIRDSLGGWEAQLPKNLKREAIRNLENVKEQIINSGMEYGKNHNPAFSSNWGKANEAANIRSRSNVALRFLEHVLPTKTIAKVFGGAVGAHALGTGISGGSSLGPVVKTAAIASPLVAAGTAGYNLAKIGYRIAKSPTLKDYYSQLMKAAVQQDGPAVAKASAKIEKEIDKENEKEQHLIHSILK